MADQTVLIGSLEAEIETLRAENTTLVTENLQLIAQVDQLQQQLQNQQLNNQPTETVFICPICVDTPGPDVGIFALLCGHVLCQNCYLGLRTRMERGTRIVCPTCRHPDVDEFVPLHFN